VTRPALLPSLLAATVLALAGCGGGDDDEGDGSNGSSTTPADMILADAGLEVCSEAEEQFVQSTAGSAAPLAVRGFAVAEDCGGSETSPDKVLVAQFGDRESVNAGAMAAKAGYPRSIVMVSGALVIVVTGPNKNTNAEAVGNAYTGATGAPVRTV
jgi:hypothetical protein